MPPIAQHRKRAAAHQSTVTLNPGSGQPAEPSRRYTIVYRSAKDLAGAARPVRRRGRGQVDTAVAMIRRFGCVVPVITTAAGEIIDGHLRVEACCKLGIPVPTILIDGLSDAEVKALRLSLNKLAEQSSWDPEALAAEFADLLDFDPDLVGFTGFTMPEVDRWLLQAGVGLDGPDPDDTAVAPPAVPVSRLGDLWVFVGGHKLLCGNSREAASYAALLGDEQVQMLASDPPYGCAIAGHVSRTHGEFVEGSGMNEAETQAFFDGFLRPAVTHLRDGAIVQLFIDSAGMYPLQTAMRSAGLV